MLQVKVGIQLASLGQPFKKALHTAARLGAGWVEICARRDVHPREMSQTGLRQLRKILNDLNLRVSAVSFPTRRGYDVGEDLERRIVATKEAMRLAYDLGASVVVNQVGRVPPAATWDDQEERDLDAGEGGVWAAADPWSSTEAGPHLLLAALSDLGRFGQHVGALLAAETGSEPAEDLEALLQRLPAGMLAVNLDPGNLVINGFSASDAVRRLGPYIQHVHAKDAVRDLARRRGVEVPLGQGSVDFPEMLGVLEENEYSGVLTVERENAADPEREVAQAVRFLTEIARS